MASPKSNGRYSSHYASSNKEHFDRLAKTYQPSRSSLELAKRAARAILQNNEFDDESTEVMDFACGSGLLSRYLAPHTRALVGVDISQGMVDLYNTTAANQGLLPEELRAVCVDILDPFRGDPFDGQRFDLIVCASAYHHFEFIGDVTIALVSFLKIGGTLMVVDLIRSSDVDLDEIFPEHRENIVCHRGGFCEEDIVSAFEGAKLEDVTFQPTVNVKKMGHDFRLFLAKGRKAAMGSQG